MVETLFADDSLEINEEINSKTKRAKKKGKELKRDKVRDLDWPKVAEIMSNGRTSSECLRRYNKIVGNRATEAACALKGPWTNEEDAKLMTLVKQNGPKKWSQIAAELPGEFRNRPRVNVCLLSTILLTKSERSAYEQRSNWKTMPREVAQSFEPQYL